MNNIIFVNKKPIIYTIFLGAVLLCSLALSTSASINLAITLTEKVIHRTLRDHTKWINILKGVVHIPLLFSILTFYIQYTIFGNKTSQKISELWGHFTSEIKQKKYLYLFIVLTVFFSVAFYKVINADILFADDMSRSHDGDRNWISFGRFISEFLSILIHSTIKLTDIAPLTQFISIIIITAAVITLLVVLNQNEKICFVNALPLTFLFLSPFFLQCFCYRFDSPYMTLSVLFPIIPFIFREDLKAYTFITFVMLILCCMSYQSGQSVYIIIVIFLTVCKIINKEDLKQTALFVAVSIAAYAASLLIYELLFAANTNRTDNNYYYSTSVSLSAVISNLRYYAVYSTSRCGGLFTRTCFFLSLAVSFVAVALKSKINKLLSAGIYAFALVLAFCLSMGPYILFEHTVISGRTMMGFNSLAAIILYIAFSFTLETVKSKKLRTAFILPVIFCIYTSVSFLYTFGNALKIQKEYNNFRYTMLFKDLAVLVNTEEKPFVAFGGSTGYCNALEMVIKNYPLEYIPVTPSEHSIWNIDYSYRFNFMFEDEFFDEKPDWPLLVSNYYHDIYGKDNHFYVDLKNHSYK